MSPYSDKYKSIQQVPVVTGATAWTCPHSGEIFILVLNESFWKGEKLYHTIFNLKQMRNHRIDVQDNPLMQNPMGITRPEEDVTVPLYMSGTIVCSDTSSPTQKQFYYCPQIVLTYPHDWDPCYIRFPKGSHSKEEEDLFAVIAEIYIDVLRSKVHDTEIEPGLRYIVHDSSFITTRLVSQVRIADAKFPNATRITDLEEDVFESQSQDIPSHRTFTSKERHSGVKSSDLSKRWQR